MDTLDQLVDRFLSWPLPPGVCSDTCVTDSQYPHPRSGTNLLTAAEARAMLEHVLAGSPPPPSGWQPIETAPKDGHVVLVLLPSSDIPYSAFWGDKKRRQVDWDRSWRMAWDHSLIPDAPTHWMPPPDSPTKGGE